MDNAASAPHVTYRLALRLDEGLIFLSDTRTNAGVDNVGSYRKLHVLRPGDDRVFVLQSAGSLATTHEVLDRIDADLAAPGRPREPRHRESPSSRQRCTSVDSARRSWPSTVTGCSVRRGATATFIIGGQIRRATRPPARLPGG